MKKNDKKVLFICILIFIGLFIFFYKAHPILICDTDDWQFASFSRHAWIKWKDWNPIRVYPEVAMGALSLIGSKVVYPFLEDFTLSLSLVYALYVSACITFFIYLLYRLINNKFNINKPTSLIVSFLFLIFNFVVFRKTEEHNVHMFYSINACTYFFYTTANVINGCLVLKVLTDDFLYKPFEKIESGYYSNNIIKLGFWIIVLYFGLFSNLYASVILASLIGAQLIIELIIVLKNNKTFIEALKDNVLRFAYIGLWIIEQIFEAFGGRAASSYGVTGKENFISLLSKTFSSFVSNFQYLNKLFILFIFVLVILIAISYLYNKKHNIVFGYNNYVYLYLISFVIITVYLIIICSKVGTGTIQRPDVIFGIMMYLFLLIVTGIVYVVKTNKLVTLFIPLIIALFMVECNTTGLTFRDSYSSNLKANEIIKINNDIIQQMYDAEEKQLDEVIIYVPYFNESTNWPYANYRTAVKSIENLVYKYRLINKKISVKEIVPIIDKNIELNIK